ncbi:MAG: hypothetical protein ACRCWI_00210 [Brevinema sp.]
MKKLLTIMSVFLLVSCGNSGEVENKKSKLLSGKLKNTSWAIPDYSVASIQILDGTATVTMNETSFLSNATIAVLEEDAKNDFVVFNIYTDKDNRVLSLSLQDPETITLAMVFSSNSLEGYKELHDVFKVEMKKQ